MTKLEAINAYDENGMTPLLYAVFSGDLIGMRELLEQGASGFRELDRATMRGFIGCKFKPVQKDGIVVEAWIPIRYIWKLNE